jgi:hypothetical protein
VRRRTKRMRTALVVPLAVVPLAVLLLGQAACGAEDRGTGASSMTDKAPPTAAQPASELYEANATVFEADEGPMLCLGAMRMSLPPRCGDVPIANWDWETVGGEESMAGATWGAYRIVGTFDGEVFTVATVGPFETVDEPETYVYETPCPEPEGGWVVPDPEHNTQEDVRPAGAYARAQPDYTISWVDHLDEELQEFSPVVFIAVFTGDAGRHEAEIRKVWNGPLCVVERDGPTARGLAKIRKEVEARLPELGLQLLGSGTGGFPPTVYIEVVVDVDGRAQALADEEYGRGIVRFLPALRPVEE